MSDLQCSVVKILRPEDPAVTVGERFALDCQGEFPELELTKAELRVEPADKYKIKLLRAQSEGAGKLRLEVLSDQVGKHELKSMQLFSGLQNLPISALSFEVRSVQDPQAPVTEPYGPLGPIMISVPWYDWMALLLVISLIGSSLAFYAFRKIERRRLMREITSGAASLSAEDELFQKLRGFQRNWDFLVAPSSPVSIENSKEAVRSLSEAYQLFLSRRFNLPASRWPIRKTLRVLKLENSDILGPDFQAIRKILNELERSQNAVLHGRDLLQFIEWIRDSAGHLTPAQGKANG